MYKRFTKISDLPVSTSQYMNGDYDNYLGEDVEIVLNVDWSDFHLDTWGLVIFKLNGKYYSWFVDYSRVNGKFDNFNNYVTEVTSVEYTAVRYEEIFDYD